MGNILFYVWNFSPSLQRFLWSLRFEFYREIPLILKKKGNLLVPSVIQKLKTMA